jgi:hypothetical protein
MKTAFQPWLRARQLLLIVAIGGGYQIDTNASHLTWLPAVLIPIGIALGLFCWLSFQDSRPPQWGSTGDNTDIDWSDPYSLTKPFFPMIRYPIRFWLLCSVIMIFTGISSSAHDLFSLSRINPESGMFLLWGLSIPIALLRWLSSAEKE